MDPSSDLAPHTSLAHAILTTLDDAVALLQTAVFEDGWDAIRATVPSDEAALRESARLYERGLTDLFAVVRASGLPADPVAWSTLKASWRRAARDQAVELSLRTALENALYSAEQTPLGDHAAYQCWTASLTRFLTSLTAGAPPRPADSDAALDWAYALLAPLEDAPTFHTAFAAAANDPPAVAHQAHLLTLPRFDLLLNAALRWLALHPTPLAPLP